MHHKIPEWAYGLSVVIVAAADVYLSRLMPWYIFVLLNIAVVVLSVVGILWHIHISVRD